MPLDLAGKEENYILVDSSAHVGSVLSLKLEQKTLTFDIITLDI